MSLLDTFKQLFSGGSAGTESPTRMHVVDTSGFAGNGGRDRLSPRQQFAMVQDLAAFAEKEKIRACAVLEGRPLREVADRSSVKGMQVFYAERSEDVAEMAYGMARKSGGALLITQNRELESRAAAAGIQTLRASTLRKAVEDGGSRQDAGRSGNGRNRSGRRSSRSRRGGDRGQRPQQGQNPAAQQERPREQPAKEQKDGGVSDLIDLV